MLLRYVRLLSWQLHLSSVTLTVDLLFSEIFCTSAKIFATVVMYVWKIAIFDQYLSSYRKRWPQLGPRWKTDSRSFLYDTCKWWSARTSKCLVHRTQPPAKNTGNTPDNKCANAKCTWPLEFWLPQPKVIPDSNGIVAPPIAFYDEVCVR